MKPEQFSYYYKTTYPYWREGMLRAADIVMEHNCSCKDKLSFKIHTEAEEKRPITTKGEER